MKDRDMASTMGENEKAGKLTIYNIYIYLMLLSVEIIILFLYDVTVLTKLILLLIESNLDFVLFSSVIFFNRNRGQL